MNAARPALPADGPRAACLAAVKPRRWVSNWMNVSIRDERTG